MGVCWEKIREDALSGKGITAEDALTVLRLPQVEIWPLLEVSEMVRRHFKGDKIRLCSIVNAKSGLCSEDCAFCSQSIRSNASIEKYPLLEEDEIVMAAREAKQRGAREFSIVASGLSMRDARELERVGNAIARIKTDVGVETCVSLGALSAENVSADRSNFMQMTLFQILIKVARSGERRFQASCVCCATGK